MNSWSTLPRAGRSAAVTFVLIAAAAALRLWPLQALGPRLAWLTFYPAVMAAALHGGIVAGLLGTLFSCLAVAFLLPGVVGQPLLKDAADWLGLVVFAVTCSAISGVTEAMHRARAQEQQANRRSLAAEAELARLNARLELAVKERTAALRESEECFRLLVDGVKDYAILMLDPEGRVLTWNHGAERLKGYAAAEIIGSHFARFYPPEDVAAGRPARELAHAGAEGRFEDEGWRVRKDGTRFWANVVITTLHDAAGHRRGFAKITRDVSERRRAEEALRQSEARLNFALQTSQIGAWQLDLLNHTAHRTLIHDRIFGHEALLPQWTYEIFLEHVLPEDRPAVDRKFREATATGADWNFECRIRRPDGEVRWIWAAGGHENNGAGRPVRMSGIVQDITEHKQAEEAIRELNASLERRVAERTAELRTANGTLADFKAALDEHAIVAMTDASGKITYVNDRFCTVSKYAREELLGQNHRLINSGYHPKDFFRELWRTIGRGRVWHGEIRNRAKDGSFYWVDTTIVPFLNEQEKPVQYIAIRTDITERKLAAGRIEQLNADLQNRARQLKEANKELESFSYSVSHDLRAPLRHVHGYVEMLTTALAGQLADKPRRYLKTITDASVEMSQLIDDLLAFSRMAKVELHEKRIPLDELMRETLRGLEIATKDRNIVWKIAPLPEVVGDVGVLRLVFTNLVGNAVKYTRGRNPAQIEIGCAGEEDGLPVFFVRDNGAGYDPRYAHKLFGVFQRLHRPEEFEGTGIGLAIVRRIVTRHGGRVWSEGQPGNGATFYFTLKPAGTA